MAKPTKLPRWADAANPADVVEPTEAKKGQGWLDTESPPHSYFNWWWSLVYTWIAWFKARFEDVTNVADYGAVGDGTDETAKIQAAIDATPTGGVLFFPRPLSNYSANALNLKPGITIRGQKGDDSNEALAAPAAGGSVLRYRGAVGFFLTLTGADSVAGVRFEDMTIDANGSTGGALSLKSFRNRITRCVVRSGGAGSVGVLFTGGASWAGESRIRDSAIYGFAVNVRSEGTATDGFLVDSLLYGATSKDIELAQGAGWLVKGNHTYGPTRTISIDVQTGSARVIHNLIEGSNAIGFIGVRQTFTQSVNTGSIAGNSIQLVSNDSIAISLLAGLATRCAVFGNSAWVFLGATGTIGIDVAANIVGDLGPNYLGTATRYRLASSSTNVIDQIGDRVEFSGAELRLNSMAAGTGPVLVRTGIGSPNGAITANPGSFYLQRDGVVGGKLWAKEAGAGNTGWVLASLPRLSAAPATGTWAKGDVVLNSEPAAGEPLGWRCVAAGTPGTWEAVYAIDAIARAGFTVTGSMTSSPNGSPAYPLTKRGGIVNCAGGLTLFNGSGDRAAGVVLGNVPAGFRPGATLTIPGTFGPGAGPYVAARVTITSGGDVTCDQAMTQSPSSGLFFAGAWEAVG